MPDAQCTHSLACEIDKAHERSHHRFTGFDPAFPAQWFYGLLRALPGDQALLSPSPALLHADLTPTLGRQNDTTWPYASASFVRLAVARLTPPISELIWVEREAKYFCKGGLTRFLKIRSDLPVGLICRSSMPGFDLPCSGQISRFPQSRNERLAVRRHSSSCRSVEPCLLCEPKLTPL